MTHSVRMLGAVSARDRPRIVLRRERADGSSSRRGIRALSRSCRSSFIRGSAYLTAGTGASVGSHNALRTTTRLSRRSATRSRGHSSGCAAWTGCRTNIPCPARTSRCSMSPCPCRLERAVYFVLATRPPRARGDADGRLRDFLLMTRRFQTLDVFTETALAGNPLAVVLDADGLDDARMQAIAAEFNLSETVFVFEPRNAINTARVRIFTPKRELPFAGHPTVGTAALSPTGAPAICSPRRTCGSCWRRRSATSSASRAIGRARRSRPISSCRNCPSGSTARRRANAEIAAGLGLSIEDIGFDRASAGRVQRGRAVSVRPRPLARRGRPRRARRYALGDQGWSGRLCLYARGGTRTDRPITRGCSRAHGA